MKNGRSTARSLDLYTFEDVPNLRSALRVMRMAGYRALLQRYVLVSALAAFLAHAQYRFETWTIDQGLPQNIVRAIHQTPDGYLWLATPDGLVGFDGIRFTVFNKGNSPGIPGNRFTSLYQDRSGDLWLGSEINGVIRFHAGSFTSYGTESGLVDGFVAAVSGDDHGNIWVLSGDKIMRWNNGRFELSTVAFPTHPNDSYSVIRRDQCGGFWATTNDKLFRFHE